MKSIDTLLQDLEKPRTLLEMKEYIEFIKEAIHSNKELKEAALLKKGKIKEFLEEYYPLYCFGHSRFCSRDSKMHIVLGNQPYDAIIESSNGDVTKLEITRYVDGKRDSDDGKDIIDHGYGKPHSITQDSLDDYHKLILKNTCKKRIRSYDDADLLIVVDTFAYFGVLDLNDAEFVSVLKSELCKISFQARNVYLLILNSNPVESIDHNIFRIDFPTNGNAYID